MLEIGQNGSKWVKIGSKWVKMGQNRVKMGQNGSKWGYGARSTGGGGSVGRSVGVGTNKEVTNPHATINVK